MKPMTNDVAEETTITSMIGTWLLCLLCSSICLSVVGELQNCFESSTDFYYLFLPDSSHIRIPLAPLSCIRCQKAEKVAIQVIDEQWFINRTLQRLTIFLNNFDIEDTTSICLMDACPIQFDYGSDSVLLNVTSNLFSHAFLSLTYLDVSSDPCTIQSRFAIFPSKPILTCTERIYLHPKYKNHLVGQILIDDCRAPVFAESIYRSSIRFSYPQLSFEQTSNLKIKPSNQTCRFIIESDVEFETFPSLKQKDHLLTTVTLISPSHPWRDESISLEPCRSRLIPFQEMAFTDDIVHLRTLHLEQGQSIQIRCPIDGSNEYLKYAWYYERYQPKYQISNNRTILLNNVTEHLQGKYMCLGDDGYETLEFEMTIQVHHRTKTIAAFYPIIILVLIILLFLVCTGLSIVIIYLYRTQVTTPLCSTVSIPKASPALTVHHDVQVTIHQSSTLDQCSMPSIDYIDDVTVYPISSWSPLEPSTSMRKSSERPCRYSTNHLDIIGQYRNVNGQPIAVSIPLVQSLNLPTVVSSRVQCDQVSSNGNVSTNQVDDDIAMLKISIPDLNAYPLMSSSRSIVSFDSELELDQFHQMSLLTIDHPSN